MASRTLSTSLLIIFNLLFFTLVTSTCTCPSPKPPTPSTPPKVTPPKPPTPSTPPKVTPPKPPTPSTPPKVTPPKPTTPSTPPKVTPPKPTTPSTPPKDTCPIDVLKLGACANLLNDLVHLVIGNPSKTTCCTLLGGLADLDAAVCLCTAIKANILGINLNVPISLSLLLNYCDKKVPSGFQCS